MVAAARCLVDPKFSVDSILRAVLRDEMISWHKKVILPHILKTKLVFLVPAK